MTRRGFGRSSNERKQSRRNHYKQILGGVCSRCGATEDLEFDHKDPKTKTVRYLWNQSNAFLDAERPLLQLLCAKHHHEKTTSEHHHLSEKWQKALSEGRIRPFPKLPIIHGTHTGGLHYKCKCLLCITAYNDFDRSQRNGDTAYVEAAKKRLAALRAGGRAEDYPLPIPKTPGRAIWKKHRIIQ